MGPKGTISASVFSFGDLPSVMAMANFVVCDTGGCMESVSQLMDGLCSCNQVIPKTIGYKGIASSIFVVLKAKVWTNLLSMKLVEAPESIKAG